MTKTNLSINEMWDTLLELGVSEQTYCAWEKDISNVAVSKVLAIAQYYGVDIGQIYFCPEHENNSCSS